MITGAILIGREERAGARTFRAVDPALGAPLDPVLSSAGPEEVDHACALAAAAAGVFAATDLEERARFLETIADRIEAIGQSD